MKLFSVFFGLLLANGAVVAKASTPGETHFGSCNFDGEFASGCIDFYDGAWDAASMRAYCQEKSRAGASVRIVDDACARNDYNTLCSAAKDDGSIANVYVNRMPASICRRYMNGTHYKRPEGGW